MTAQLLLGMKLPKLTMVTCAYAECGESFPARRSTARFCSPKCRLDAHRDRHAGRNAIDVGVAKTVFGTNADLMKVVARLYIPPGAIVLDTTFGRGEFWRKIPRPWPFSLIRSDLHVGRDLRADFRRLPLADESVDVIVLDPPYTWGWHPRMTLGDRYNGGGSVAHLRGVDDILELYRAGMAEARRVLRRGGRLMVKCQDALEGRRQRRVSIDLFNFATGELGMVDRDKLILIATTTPLFRKGQQQRHARKTHSYM